MYQQNKIDCGQAIGGARLLRPFCEPVLAFLGGLQVAETGRAAEKACGQA